MSRPRSDLVIRCSLWTCRATSPSAHTATSQGWGYVPSPYSDDLIWRCPSHLKGDEEHEPPPAQTP